MCERKPVPHKHAEVIKAWVDGITVQVQGASGTWYDIDPPSERLSTPEFKKDCVYRIKPQMSDLERYGVEVGDVWAPPNCYPQTEYGLFVAGMKKGTPIGTSCITLSGGLFSVVNSTLLFRRGVVNKL